MVVPEGVAEFVELVEDHQVLARIAQFPTLVENFLDIGFAARCGDHFAGDALQPLEPFAGHLFRKNGDGSAGQKRGNIGAAPAVVAGGGPDRLGGEWIELAGDQAGCKTAVGGSHFMGTGGKPAAGQGDDGSPAAGKFRGDDDVVDVAEQAAVLPGRVFPGDTVEAGRVDVPETGPAQGLLNFRRNFRGVLHHRKGGQRDALLTAVVNSVRQYLAVYGQIQHGLGSFCNVAKRFDGFGRYGNAPDGGGAVLETVAGGQDHDSGRRGKFGA